MHRFLMLFVLAFWAVACSNADRNQEAQTPINTDTQPITSAKNELPKLPDSLLQIDTFVQTDTTKKIEKPKRLPAQAKFETTKLSYGTISQGTIKELVFKFKNIGELPLEIKDVRGSCGCTVGSYTFLPIRAGETSEIKARFDSKGKMGNQKSTLTVTTNGDPATYVLNLEGIVTESAKDSLR